MQRTGVRIKGTESDLWNKIKEKLFTKRTSKVKEDVTGQVTLKVMEKA
jgi:4Fe-4S ferredoxin